MRILFQGDSVTDAGRSRENLTDLGPGYVATTAELLRKEFPEIPFEFVNRGISGNRSSQLLDRLQEDFLDLHADIVTILIGVNDSWHRYMVGIHTSKASYEENYRKILTAVKKTGAKIVVLEPFMVQHPALPNFRVDLDGKIDACRKLAMEFADAYLPLDGLANADAVVHGINHLTNDGVHPNTEGRIWLGTLLAETLIPMIREMK